MLKDTKAFSSFSVNDLDKAKEFYGQTLGLETTNTEMGTLDIKLGKSSGGVMIYPKSDHQPATFTVLNFLADDLEQTVDQLTAKGVKFEHYDKPDIKTDERGIAGDDHMKIAWFKDPAGNILSVIQGGQPK